MLLSLLDEIWKVSGPRGVKAEDGGIFGGDAKNVYGRLVDRVEQTMGERDIRKGPGEEAELLPVNGGQGGAVNGPSRDPGG